MLAKPAERTPLIAAQGIAILLEAGLPPGVVQYCQVGGNRGARD
ncbi:aldehyde dehydrogenase family protein [Shigella flexneri]